MRKLLLIILVTSLSNNLFSQSNTITVNKLVDFEIGMTYDKLIEKYPNPTEEEKNENNIDIYYSSIKLSNGIILTNLLLSFYKNNLYDISTEYSNTLHLGLVNKYGYKSVKDMTFNGYYGTSYKGNITAVYIDNKIWIVDNSIRKLVSTEGF
ncbi:hypothetical protein [Flavobacterium sp.]|jgi:hypothetical protein|uniref:hypothetical protein n=1 Tax=Flavobacterium sp. TaxID=239 RepID=UPI0037C14FE5